MHWRHDHHERRERAKDVFAVFACALILTLSAMPACFGAALTRDDESGHYSRAR